MLAEVLVRSAFHLLGNHAPDGRRYWAARYWDRTQAEEPPELAVHYTTEKQEIRSLIAKYATDAGTILEIACGTGEFTLMLAQLAAEADITALDISAQAIEHASRRVREGADGKQVTFRQADVWSASDLGTYDVVVCVDAIHHLGRVPDVLGMLKRFVKPGGILIGNLWTLDNFHDLQRHRFGRLQHGWQSAMFLYTALLIRLSGGRLRTSYYRTHLLPAARAGEVLARDYEVLYLEEPHNPHFVAFVCRPRS